MATSVTTRDTLPLLARTSRRRRHSRPVALIASLSLATAVTSATSASAQTITTPVTTASTAEIDLALDLSVGPVDWGFGPTVWQYYTLTATNTSAADVTIGLEMDIAQQGVIESLSTPPNLLSQVFSDSELVEVFTETIPAGGTYSTPVPDWPGMTYVFSQLDPGPQEIVRTTSAGLYVPFFDLSLPDFGIGLATLSGPELFPGLTATVTASGLPPGAEYGVYMAPGIDYFSFLLSGAVLPADAFEAGRAVVAADGSFSATVIVPLGTPLGGYQLVVGDPGSRSWPAGTIESFTVTAPPEYVETATPTGGDVMTELATTSAQISVLFSSVTEEGTTSASVATTGPVLDGFQFAANPAFYFHLETTAVVDGPIEVCLDYDPSTVTEPPRLYHFVNDLWVDVTTSSTTGRVCGVTDSFSPFVLGLPKGVELANKQQCKDGGWSTSTLPPFINQGDCVSYFEARGR